MSTKETIDVSIAEGDRRGEVRHYGVIASDLEPLDAVVRALRAPDRTLHLVYEAGCRPQIFLNGGFSRGHQLEVIFVMEATEDCPCGDAIASRKPMAV